MTSPQQSTANSSNAASFTADNPFRLVLLFPPMDDSPEALAPLTSHDNVEFITVPYMESSEARTNKGGNNGALTSDWAGELPVLTEADHEVLAGAHGIIMLDLPADISTLAPNLVWAQSIGAGYDHIDLDELKKLPLGYANATGVASVPIAEFVMARLLGVWKNLRTLEQQQAEEAWTPAFGRTVQGLTLGVVGLGAIGREVARRGRAFGMHVLASRGSAQPGDTDPDVDELFPADAVDEMLARCDAVVVAAPASAKTNDMFDADRIAVMPAGSVLCNVARGTLVVDADLVAALESGHLGAAILDVTREEPLPAGDPLWTAPNCYISPHSAAALDRYQELLFALAADNLQRVLAGESLRNTVFDQRA